MLLSDVLGLKKELQSRFGVELHFHDVCPKPYFTVETRSESAENFISEYFEKMNLVPVFSKDRFQFTLKK